jgi:uncharacterized protein (TIGR03437 family)
VAVGSTGVLYGTTPDGGDDSACLSGYSGPDGCGVIFSLAPPAAPGGGWTEAVLFTFNAVRPEASVVTGGSGALYGITAPGPCWLLFGPNCWTASEPGYVYSLTPPATLGGAWTRAVLDSFPATVGYSNVVIGGGGLPYVSIYSTSGPPSGQVLSLSPPVGGSNHAWTALWNFTDAQPDSLAVGGGGTLYGTAAGGVSSSGSQTYSVWSLTPPATPGAPWSESTLYSFTAASAGNGISLLTVGSNGTLYGVAYTIPCGNMYCGAIFSLTPPAAAGAAWAETTLYSFTGGGVTGPEYLVIAGDGTLYGTTRGGGAAGLGTVFRLKLAVPEPAINPNGLVTAASYTAPVSPGSIASAFGDFFLPSPISATQSPLPASLSGLSLAFDTSAPAPLFFVSGGQVNLQVPWELAGQPQANLAATLDGQTGTAQTVNLATSAPAIFATNAQGSGQGAILDTSNRLVDASSPATPGSTVLQIFCTGLGPVTVPQQPGSPAPADSLVYTAATPT